MNILIDDGKNLLRDDVIALLNRAGEIALINHGINTSNVEISLSIVTEEEIKSINREYRGIDKVTDVLSFPQYENYKFIMDENSDIIAIGDIVICNDVAIRQATEYAHSYEREMVYLFVHSMMHLLGYDHMNEEDKILMRKKEEQVLSEMGIMRY